MILLALIAPAMGFCTSGPAAASPGNRLVPYVGASLPLLALDRLDGGRGGTAAMRGHVVLVNFFVTWCEPCRPELASLDRLRSEAGPRGIEILAISVVEVEARLRRFFADNPVGLRILLGRDRAASRAFAIDALPSTVVLERAGRPRLAVRGDLDGQRPEVRAALDELQAESAEAHERTKTGGTPP